MSLIWRSHACLRSQPKPFSISHIILWRGRVQHMNHFYTYGLVMLHIWRVMLHIWTSQVSRIKESCHTYEGIMSHIWKSHVTHMKESCHINESCYSNASFFAQTHSFFKDLGAQPRTFLMRSLLLLRPRTPSGPGMWLTGIFPFFPEIHVWHDGVTCVTRFIHMWKHNLFTCATWLIHMCDMTHSYVRHDSFICATWLIHMCDMTLSHVRHDLFICMTIVSHEACASSTSSRACLQFMRVTWLVHTCQVTRSYGTSHVQHDSHETHHERSSYVYADMWIKDISVVSLIERCQKSPHTATHYSKNCNNTQNVRPR